MLKKDIDTDILYTFNLIETRGYTINITATKVLYHNVTNEKSTLSFKLEMNMAYKLIWWCFMIFFTLHLI